MQFLVVVAKFLLLVNKVHSKFFVMFCKLCALEICVLVQNSLFAVLDSRAQPMHRHCPYISAYMVMLPMYHIDKIAPIYIGNICS